MTAEAAGALCSASAAATAAAQHAPVTCVSAQSDEAIWQGPIGLGSSGAPAIQRANQWRELTNPDIVSDNGISGPRAWQAARRGAHLRVVSCLYVCLRSVSRVKRFYTCRGGMRARPARKGRFAYCGVWARSHARQRALSFSPALWCASVRVLAARTHARSVGGAGHRGRRTGAAFARKPARGQQNSRIAGDIT